VGTPTPVVTPTPAPGPSATPTKSVRRAAVASALTSPYPAEVLADHPLAYYRLDEATGPTAFDSSGNRRDGTYAFLTSFGTPGALVNDPDTAVANPGGAQFAHPLVAQAGASLPAGSSPRTLELWFRSTNTAAAWLVRYGDFSNHMFGIYSDGILHIYADGGTHLDVTPLHALYDDTWHLIDLTYDGVARVATLFMDGQVAGGGTLLTTTMVPGDGLAVGEAIGGFDEAAVYGSVLSPDRVAAHWTRGGSRSTAGCAPAPTSRYPSAVLADSPALYLRLGDLVSDATDRVAFDASGGCHNGAFASGTQPQTAGALAADPDGAVSNPGGGLYGQATVTQSGSNLPAGSSARTIELWFRSTNTSAEYLMRYGNYFSTQQFALYSDGALHVYADNNVHLDFTPSHDLYNDAWHLLDVTYDGAVATMFVDGQILGSGALIVNTTVPGNGLEVGGAVGDYDEAGVYPSALSPDRIAAHWTAGGSKATAACAAKPTTPYPTAVLTDTPSVYLRLGDLAVDSTDRVAFDASGGCHNGAFASGAMPQLSGALAGDTSGAVTNPGAGLFHQALVSQSGSNLPAGKAARTMELWYRSTNPSAEWLMRYGDYNGTHQFALYMDGNLHIYADGNVHLDIIPPHALLDYAWHLLDVTYDGNLATMYMDGQVVGQGALIVSTSVPGNGLSIGAPVGDYQEAAVYPSALGPDRIAAHWTRGGSTAAAACIAKPTSPYAAEVLADTPSLYLRLGDLVSDPAGRVAFDASGGCHNGAFATGTQPRSPGALIADSDGAVGNSGGALFHQSLVSQSGSALPSGFKSRTLELWYRSTNSSPEWLMRYGDWYTVHQFALYADGNLHVYADANAHLDFIPSHALYDNAWHLIDVSYDGATAIVTAYLDGQVIGEGTLNVSTTVPGSGLEVGGAVGSYDEAAVYPTALSPDRIAAHWTRGGSQSSSRCLPAATAPYPSAILADAPAVYLRLGDLVSDGTDRVAFDSSGGCHNGAFATGARPQTSGAIVGDTDGAVTNPGGALFHQSLVTASDATLPSGTVPRTMELWYRSTNAAAEYLMRYGDYYGNHQFGLYTDGNLHVYADGGLHVDFTTPGLFDDSWHLIDVTYDGSATSLYIDGSLIGTGTLAVNTIVPGNGLEVGGAVGSYDEAAVYPTVLSAAKIKTHWTVTPPGYTTIAGNVTGSGSPLAGVLVQACPSGSGACPNVRTNSFGLFRLALPAGTYAVTAFPPPGSPYPAPKTAGPFQVPPATTDVTFAFTLPGALPPSASFSSPSNGTQQGVPASVYWGEPSVYTVAGQCSGGFGALVIQAPNTSTGQTETRIYPLVETPTGSGTYIAQIPPLSPLHGTATVSQSVNCLGHTSLLPDSGPAAGGTAVLISGSGFTGATAVHFGAANAATFSVVSDSVLNAVTPAGSGTASVSVTSAQRTTTTIGNFNYVDVTGVDTTSGPAAGGTAITINGQGFTNVQNVVFGLLPAQSFTVLSPTQVRAVAPPGMGTVDVQVINGFGTSAPVTSAQFAYQGGPPGSSSINEGTGANAPAYLASQTLVTCGQAQAASQTTGIDFGRLCGAANFIFDSMGPAGVLKSVAAATLLAVGLVAVGVSVEAALVIAPVLVAAWTIYQFFKLFIDPSGNVVDTTGNPVSGATVTLLGQNVAGGPYNPIPASSGSFVPATNPQTTASTGAFHWDALAGSYEVQASAANCHVPGNTSQPNVTTNPFVIPPPAVGLILTLECPGATPPKPTVSGLSVNYGPTAGGTRVDITGTGLGGVTAVHFGSAAASGVTVLSPYAVSALAPPGTGKVDVTVDAPGGTSNAVVTDTFTYVAAVATPNLPTVGDVSPAAGPLTGGTVVTIRGTNFSGASSVTFGNTPATQMTVVSASVIQAVAPAVPSAGVVHISVTGPAGTSAPSAADTFLYSPAVAALPAMANGAYGGYSTTTYIQNLGTQPAAIAILYFDANGTLVGKGDETASLAPHALWTVRQDNGNSLAPGVAGSGIVFSTQPVAAFVNEFAPHGDATSYTAIPLPSGAAKQLFAPAIARDAYGGYTTGLGIINAGGLTTTLTVTYRNLSGTTVKTQTIANVPPGAYVGVYSGSSGSVTDANLPVNFAGTATIQSSAGSVAAIVNELGPGGQFSSYDAVAQGSTILYAPVVFNDAYGGFNTGIGLQNLAASPAMVTISYAGQVGTGSTTQTYQEHLTLAPSGYAGDYNGGGSTNPVLPDGFHGSATIQSDQPLASIVNEVAAPATAGGPTTQSTAYNTFAAGLSAAHVPLVENAGSDGLTTGLGIENVGTSAASVVITYYDASNGNLLTQKTVTIAPGSFLGAYTPADLTTAGTRATAVITTSSNVLAVIVNEVGTGTFMSYDGQ
jgi:hypothetical protein